MSDIHTHLRENQHLYVEFQWAYSTYVYKLLTWVYASKFPTFQLLFFLCFLSFFNFLVFRRDSLLGGSGVHLVNIYNQHHKTKVWLPLDSMLLRCIQCPPVIWLCQNELFLEIGHMWVTWILITREVRGFSCLPAGHVEFIFLLLFILVGAKPIFM